MSAAWRFQIRIYLDPELAELARGDMDAPALRPLADVLRAHRAALKSQYDAFAEYVAEAEANDVANYPLYRWTRVTLDDPEKSPRHRTAFTLRIDGQEVYAQPEADAIEAALQPLLADGLLTRISRHDTNPANNMPVPEQFRAQ
jgi:hypothetical protein